MKLTDAERTMLEVLGQTILAMHQRCPDGSGVLMLLHRVVTELNRGDLTCAAEAIDDERERQSWRAERAARRGVS